MIPGLRDFSFFPCSTFIYESILIKFSINVNIKKTQIFYEIKFDLKGHSRSYKTTFLFQNLRGNSCSPSFSYPFLLLLSLYVSLSFLSLLFISSLFLFSILPPPLHRPYIHPMPLYLFSLPRSSSLFLTLTYVLMDNFLSLFCLLFQVLKSLQPKMLKSTWFSSHLNIKHKQS